MQQVVDLHKGTLREAGVESRRPYVVPTALWQGNRGRCGAKGAVVVNQSQMSYARVRAVREMLSGGVGGDATVSELEQWDQVVDVIVIGSGAAGLSAATLAADGGSTVVILERADMVGGTTGVSGGMPWVPLNHHLADVGMTDTAEEALTYIRRLTLGREPSSELVETFVEHADHAIAYLEEHTPVEFSAPPMFSDYYADLPGGKVCGRSIEPVPFPAAAELGEWAPLVRTSPFMPRLTMEEGGRYLAYGEAPDYGLVATRERDDIRVLGGALAAALFKGVLDRNIPVRTGVRVKELVSRQGTIVGVRAEQDEAPLLVGARRGVVLACGGFEWNEQMVQAFIGHPIDPLSPPYNEGDGHIMAMEAGAVLANMWSYWGQPALLDPDVTYEGRPALQFSTGRNMPGSIIVNKRGERFVNEGTSYQDMPRSFGIFDPVAIDYPNEAPVWMVFDHRLRESTMILSMVPGGTIPDWVESAPTLRELSARIGLDPDALERTVDRFNLHAAVGEDPDFHRGTVWWEAFMSGGPSPRNASVRSTHRPSTPSAFMTAHSAPRAARSPMGTLVYFATAAAWSTASMRPATRRPPSSARRIRAEGPPSVRRSRSGTSPAGMWRAGRRRHWRSRRHRPRAGRDGDTRDVYGDLAGRSVRRHRR